MLKLRGIVVRNFQREHASILAIVVTLAMAMCCSMAVAQSGAGSIQGTVTDATGGILTSADIRVTNQATNVEFTAKSNEVGFFQVPGLFAGTYSVAVSAPNMKTYKTTVQLLVAQSRVVNPVLTAGAVTEQVTVTAPATQLTTTDSATIADTLESERINQLPENGRSLATLLGMTIPGLEGSATGGAMLNGLMPEAFSYVADGVPLDNRQFGGQNQAQAQEPDPDAIQQVRAETVLSGAEYSSPGTAVITTKSGTNRLHGALFETAVNNAWGVAKAREDPSNFSAPHYVRNEFGISAGGPIIIPKVYDGKDKSFWFAAYERYSLAQGETELFSVPTQDMRNGNFGLLSGLAVPETLYDPSSTYNSNGAACPGTPVTAQNPNGANPYCRNAFPSNQIPSTSESPTMKTINDLTPMPNISENANPFLTPNLRESAPNYTVIPTLTFRLDHVFNENNRVYLRYQDNLQTSESLRHSGCPAASSTNCQPALVAADGFPANSSGLGTFPSRTYAASLGFTHIFSSSFYSETIVSNQWFSQHNFAGGVPYDDYEQKLGLPNNFGEMGFPSFGEYGAASTDTILNNIDGTQWIYGMSSMISTIDENLTKVLGKHQMQFGGRYRHERFGYLPTGNQDTVTFAPAATALYDPGTSTNFGALAATGDPNAEAFLGAASSYGVNLEPPYEHFHDMEIDGYFQDNYHMTRNLTWNIGLRYEAHPAIRLDGDLMQSFDLKNDALALADTPANLIAKGATTQAIINNLEAIGAKLETFSDAGIPAAGIKSYNFNFLPRIGVAYQPFGGRYGTVIRGGYGRYVYPIPVRTTYGGITAQAPFAASYSQNYGNPAQSPDNMANYLLRNPQPVVMGVNSANVVNTSSQVAFLPGSVGPYTLSVDEAPDYVTETNFTIEQPLKGNSALRLSWVWTHGTNLDQMYAYNNPPSTFSWEVATGTLPPQGTTIGSNQYYATATQPYDKTTWGGNTLDQKSGWSNDNSLQANYQKLYHNGVAWQISYVWSRPFRVGGNYFRGATASILPSQNFATSGLGSYAPFSDASPIVANLPPARPSGIASYAYWHQLDAWENYIADTAIPRHNIQFTGIYDLPFGRGKRFLGGSNRAIDEVVGGWQIAGHGQVGSQSFQVAHGNYGPHSAVQVYKHRHKVSDCTSGVCISSYQWFNGYIPSTELPSSGNSTVVNGLPSSYIPYEKPINTANPNDWYYNTNDVQTNLQDARNSDVQSFVPDAYSGMSDPAYKDILQGPMNYTVDLSLFKVFPITESTRLRFNMDAFNSLNVQGFNNPNTSTGLENMLTSYNTPRQLQFTLRYEF